MKTITIVSDDRVGLLADISYVLGKSKINIESISVDVISGKAIVVLSLSDAEKGKQVLEASNYKLEAVNSLILKLPDEPGALNTITSILSKEGISITNVHILSRSDKTTILSLSADKPKRASTLLSKYLMKSDAY